jgi:hypothetical protein
VSLDIPTLSGIIAVAGVVVGFLIAILQLRDLIRTRQTDLVMRLYETFDSREFQEAWVETLRMEFTDYKDYLRKYGATSDKPSYVSVNMVGGFFEGLGILLKRKLIDIALVDDLFSSDIILGWHKMKPIVEGWRKQFNRPQMSEWFEYLHDEMQKREEQLEQASAK